MTVPRNLKEHDKVVEEERGERAIDAVTDAAGTFLEVRQMPNHDGCRAPGGELRCAVWLGRREGGIYNKE